MNTKTQKTTRIAKKMLKVIEPNIGLDVTLAYEKIVWVISKRRGKMPYYVIAELAEATALLRPHIPSKHTNT